MDIIRTRADLREKLMAVRKEGKKTGYVPTMGALHQGHASLVSLAAGENDFTVASIFVNPAQFNDPADLKNYPRTPQADYQLLENHGCHLVFEPSTEEMYPNGVELIGLDLGFLGSTMEGKFRKGHFQGMVTIVYKLLTAIVPDRAYFGEKDFQQLAIVRFMADELNMPVEIIGCPTIREPDGLAMSSRNIRLTPAERSSAHVIFDSMQQFTALNQRLTVAEVKTKVIETIGKNGLFSVEYFELVDSSTLKTIADWKESVSIRACIAVKTSGTRLIDNMEVPLAPRT